MALDAVLFDIDGTLLDTNAAHVKAWSLVFDQHGYRIGRDRIEVEIGKGGDKLVPAIFGREVDARDGDRLRKAQAAAFADIARKEGIQPIAGAWPLLAEVRRQRLKCALATSSSKQHLAVLEEAVHVNLTTLVDHIVTADDAKESKPAPAVITAGIRKLEMSPAQCAMVGDTLYDMQAAKLAGVIGLGVRTGYQSEQTLLQHGARAVFADAAELLERLDEALRLASPTAIHLTQEVLELLMREALEQARHGYENGEAPIGCVLADGNGRILARGHNQANRLGDRTAHAEMVTFRNAAGRVAADRKDCILVSTLEPCVMCTGAAMEAAIDTIVYGLKAPADSGTGRVEPPQTPESQMPRIVGGVLPKESRALFERFKHTAQDPLQRAFTEQLLALTP